MSWKIVAIALASALGLPIALHAEGPKPLTTLLWDDRSGADGVNDAGQIVGGDRRPILWNGPDQTPIVLGSLGASDQDGGASSVNNFGQVVGWSKLATGYSHAFLWTPDSGMRDLGTLPGRLSSYAFDISDSGLVVGASVLADDYSSHAFAWSPLGGMSDLGTLGGASSTARAVNSAGQVVGEAQTASGKYHAFLWTSSGGVVDLGTLGGSTSVALDINEDGTIVGWSTDSQNRRQAFVIAPGGRMADLTPEDDDCDSGAGGINDTGSVVGWTAASGSQSRGFVWTPSAGLAALGWDPYQRAGPSKMNNRGLIVGFGSEDRPPPISGVVPVIWQWSSDDVAVDRGSLGLWLLGDRGTTWSVVSPVNPTVMARGDLDGNGVHDLVVSFGSAGVWIWMNHTAQFQLHPFAADRVAVGDLDSNGRDDIVLSFPGYGTWVWWDRNEWQQLHPMNPNLMAILRLAPRGYPMELVASFPGEGVWTAITFGGQTFSWTQIHQRDASVLVAADVSDDFPGGEPGREIVIGFAGAGLWVYNDYRQSWAFLHPFDVRHVVAGDLDGKGQNDLVVDFGPTWGLWMLKNGTNWTQLHGFSAAHVALADLDGLGRDEIVVDFGAPYGIYVYSTQTGWRPLRNVRVEGLLTGGFH